MKLFLFTLGALNFYTQGVKLHPTLGVDHQISLYAYHLDGEEQIRPPEK